MEATMGMSTASATSWPIVTSKRPMTEEASMAVNRFTTSHGRRALVVSSKAA